MYAIVEIAGQQFKVVKDQKLFVHRLAEERGSKVSFDKVYLLDDGKKVSVGTPAVKDASVEAKVLNHLKGDKVVVFKKKRRKGYRVKNGHRQDLTELVVEQILTSGNKKVTSKETAKPAPEKDAPKVDIEETDYSKMTVAALKAIAKEKGVAGYSRMKKSELISALEDK